MTWNQKLKIEKRREICLEIKQIKSELILFKRLLMRNVAQDYLKGIKQCRLILLTLQKRLNSLYGKDNQNSKSKRNIRYVLARNA